MAVDTDIGTGTAMVSTDIAAITGTAVIGAIAIGAAGAIRRGVITARTALGVMGVASAGTKVEYQVALKLTTAASQNAKETFRSPLRAADAE
jgi:hypothetical protein